MVSLKLPYPSYKILLNIRTMRYLTTILLPELVSHHSSLPPPNCASLYQTMTISFNWQSICSHKMLTSTGTRSVFPICWLYCKHHPSLWWPLSGQNFLMLSNVSRTHTPSPFWSFVKTEWCHIKAIKIIYFAALLNFVMVNFKPNFHFPKKLLTIQLSLQGHLFLKAIKFFYSVNNTCKNLSFSLTTL